MTKDNIECANLYYIDEIIVAKYTLFADPWEWTSNKRAIESYSLRFRSMVVNAEELKAKLQYLCNCEDVVNCYKAEAADFICVKYSWEDVVEQTVQLYQDRGIEYENFDGKQISVP